jgi:hypothetical protein
MVMHTDSHEDEYAHGLSSTATRTTGSTVHHSQGPHLGHPGSLVGTGRITTKRAPAV